MRVVPSSQSLRYLRHLLHPQPSTLPLRACHPFLQTARSRRHFHASRPLQRIETHILSDIGEGVKEVQIIQWFVEEGAQIEEWNPLCEVQSDKAAVEITSKFTGIIKKLYFKRDDIVQVGDPMVDIEVEGEEEPAQEGDASERSSEADMSHEEQEAEGGAAQPKVDIQQTTPTVKPEPSKGKHASLATPAVRGLLKEHGLNVEDINGTGKDGRVMKDDVYKHLETRQSAPPPSAPTQKPPPSAPQQEMPKRLTPIQSAMFKSMTASLSIPHFLYSDTVNITALSAMRRRLNSSLAKDSDRAKLSYMPFFIKAVSLALNKYPILNARLDTSSDPSRPQLMLRSNHNIGVAMDTPAGLLVPVIKSVNALSMSAIASEIARLGELGKAGKLSNEDLSGGTITVSNIGNIGGEVLAPVIVEGQLAIMGAGKVKTVPVFNAEGIVEKAEMVTLSWSADHRVVDGATMARAAEVVRGYLEEPGTMMIDMS